MRLLKFILVVTPLFLSSCFASKSFVHFEVLEPAAFSYPETVGRIGLINRAPYLWLSHDAEETPGKQSDKEVFQIIDTIVARNLVKGFIEGVGQSEVSYFSELPLIDYRRNDTAGKDLPLDPGLLDQIFSLNDLDAIVSVEYYDPLLSRSYTYFSFEQMDFAIEYELIPEVFWRVYTKGEEDPLDVFHFRDTLYYYNYSDMKRSDLWSSTSVIRDGYQEAGFRYGIRQVPLWVDVSRILYRGGDPLLSEAALMVDAGEWSRAVEHWNKLTGHESPRVAARAYHNIAISLEMEDRIDVALEMTVRANELWPNEITEGYRKALEERWKIREELLKQIR